MLFKINSNKRCFWILLLQTLRHHVFWLTVTNVVFEYGLEKALSIWTIGINSNKRCFWIVYDDLKKEPGDRLTVTNVVFEWICYIPMQETYLRLTVTNVVFELFKIEKSWYKFFKINSNKRCFWIFSELSESAKDTAD